MSLGSGLKTGLGEFRAAAWLAALCGLLHLFLFTGITGQILEGYALSYWFMMRGPLPTPPEVAVVAIDEASFKAFGISKHALWPRQYHVALIKRLKELGARRVAFDLVFRGAGTDPAVDQELAAAFASFPTVLAHEPPAAGETESEALYVADELFTKSAEALGTVQAISEDGMVRGFTPAPPGARSLSAAGAGVAPFGLPKPGDYINFYGPGGTIQTVSFYKVLDQEDPLPPGYFKDKVVFVGASLGLSGYALSRDWAGTPYGPKPTFGVEINATQAANILRGDWIRNADVGPNGVWLNIIVMVLAFLLLRLSPGRAALLFVFTVLFWSYLSFAAFERHLYLPRMTVLLVLFLAAAANWIFHYLYERKNRLWIEHAFGNYVPAAIVKWLQADPSRLRREVHEIESAILFTDIQGFTSWVETSPAEIIQPVMNAYSDAVEKCLDESEATLANTWGDAKFVIWGAPRAVENAAERALSAVLAIKRALRELRASGAIPDFVTRFGLNFGVFKVGNFGSSGRFQYTAYGDAVNFAARLEPLNKEFGTDVLFTGALKERLGAGFSPVLMARVLVAGKSQAAEVFTVFDGEALEQGLLARWAAAFEDFAARRWEAARRDYAELAEAEPRFAKAAATYLEFIAKYELKPPAAEWRGELAFKQK